MELAWFIYAIAIIFIAIVACAVSVMVWVLTSRKSWLVSAAAFACYVFEQAIILYAEYSGSKPYLMDYFVHGLEFPLVSIPLSVAFVTLIWTWAAVRVHAPVSGGRIAVGALLFAMGSFMVAPIGEWATTARTYAYFALRDLAILGSLAFAAAYTMRRATENEKADALRSKGFWKVAVALAVVMFVEDTVFILGWTPSFDADSVGYRFFWHLTERNITENVFMIACAVGQVLAARSAMRVFAQHPAEHVLASDVTGKERVASDIDMKLPIFCDERGMSKREREVLRLLLLEKSTQEIANELYLSIGTVKAHLHRIYLKAEVTNRQDLIKMFWRS